MNLAIGNPIFGYMKRIALLLSAMTMCSTSALRAQDAATEERMNKMSGAIEDLKAANEALRKHLDALLKEVETVREQATKPAALVMLIECGHFHTFDAASQRPRLIFETH